MSNNLEKKIALITGASRGIGHAIAKRLAAEKMILVLTARSEPELNQVKEKLKGQAHDIYLYPADLSDISVPEKIIKQTINKYGMLDILINNAGVCIKKQLAETTADEWDLHMAVNARAPFLLCKYSLPYLEKSEIKTIINIASVVGRKGYINQGAYTASKHALLGLTRVLAKEAAEKNIRVHAISPGGVATDMISKLKPELKRNELILPEEIAEVIVFLLTKLKHGVIDEVNIRRSSSEPWSQC